MKIQRKIKVLEMKAVESGMLKSTVVPPFYRLLWFLGINSPPPVFNSFRKNAWIFGLAFGVIFGFLMYFILWKENSYAVISTVVGSLVAGCVFGLLMARIVEKRKGRLDLGRWEDLGTIQEENKQNKSLDLT